MHDLNQSGSGFRAATEQHDKFRITADAVDRLANGRLTAHGFPRPIQRVAGAAGGIGAPGLAFGPDAALETANLILEEILDVRGRGILALGVAESGRVFRQTGAVVILAEDQFEPPRVYRRAFGSNIRLHMRS